MHTRTVVAQLCAPILRFCAALDGATAERQIQNARFRQFRNSLRKDIVANYGSIWTQFSMSVRGCSLQCTKRFVVPSVGGATRFAKLRWKFSNYVT